MSIAIKICGLTTPEALDAAIEAGADFIGLVAFPPSPRHLGQDAARALAGRVRGRAGVVLLTVDASDAELDALVSAVRPDVLQLHGRESPGRTAAVARRSGLEMWKALAVETAQDLDAVRDYPDAARVLLDAKPPKGSTRPGGNAVSFDWSLLTALDRAKPFVLSGGLTPDNVAEAIRVTAAPAVDVSSGVESAPGVKDPEKIRAFIRAARAASEK